MQLQQQITLEEQAALDELALLQARFGDDAPLAIDLRGDFWRVIETLPDGSERIVYTKLDGTLAGIAPAYFEHLQQGERKQQERESLEARARAEGVPAFMLEHRREQQQLRARRQRALAPLRVKYGYSRTLRRDTQPRTPARKRAPRRRPHAATATGPRRARSPDRSGEPRPRPCLCGCGEDLSPGRRKYVDETHRKREQRARHRPEALDELYRTAVLQARRAGELDGLEALELLVTPSKRVLAALAVRDLTERALAQLDHGRVHIVRPQALPIARRVFDELEGVAQ